MSAPVDTVDPRPEAPPAGRSKRTAGFLLAGLLVALVLAGGVSHYASSEPDGLNKVAIDKGLDQHEKDSATAGSPLADYGVEGVESERLSGGLAGVIGVVVTFTLAGGVAYVATARRRRAAPPR
nr:PDGLE domain-containing protein [Motilibacter deserti]